MNETGRERLSVQPLTHGRYCLQRLSQNPGTEQHGA